jgi:hypothetical protein
MTVLGEVEPSRAPWRERQFWSGSVIRNIVATGPKMAQKRHSHARVRPTLGAEGRSLPATNGAAI